MEFYILMSAVVSVSALVMSLPEVILRVVLARCTWSEDDREVFRCLPLVSKAFYAVIRCNWVYIVEYYTYTMRDWIRLRYLFCDMLHREAVDAEGNDLPAAIVEDGTLQWYRYGKQYR